MKRSTGAQPLKAVFFDVGGTILHVRPSVGHVYAEAVRRRGVPADPDGINRAFRAAWDRSLLRRKEMGYATDDRILREEWRMIVADSFDGQVPGDVAGEAFEELYEHFAGPSPWSLVEGAREAFEALRAQGLRLGVLSNWDSRLHHILGAFGLEGLFDPLVVSYAVGVEKPHPDIFIRAAREAEAAPAELLMVGDSWEQDIEPALDQGWRAIWVSEDAPREAASSRPGLVQAARFDQVLALIQNPEITDAGHAKTAGK